jgi:hypothetical protein
MGYDAGMDGEAPDRTMLIHGERRNGSCGFLDLKAPWPGADHAETTMLTKEQLQLLKQIHAGEQRIGDLEAKDLLDRGLIARQEGGFDITAQGRDALGLREGFGDAIVDAVLPGEGARQAEEKH